MTDRKNNYKGWKECERNIGSREFFLFFFYSFLPDNEKNKDIGLNYCVNYVTVEMDRTSVIYTIRSCSKDDSRLYSLAHSMDGHMYNFRKNMKEIAKEEKNR